MIRMNPKPGLDASDTAVEVAHLSMDSRVDPVQAAHDCASYETHERHEHTAQQSDEPQFRAGES